MPMTHFDVVWPTRIAVRSAPCARHAVLHERVHARCVPSQCAALPGRRFAAIIGRGRSPATRLAARALRRADADRACGRARRMRGSGGSCVDLRRDRDTLPMFGFGKTIAIRSPTPSRPSAGSRRSRATIRWRCTRALLAELGAARRARRRGARRRGSRPCSSSTRTTQALRKTLTVAIHRAREPQSSKIENQLWSALFDLTQAFLLVLRGVRARGLRSRAEHQVAGAAAGAHRAPDHPPRPRREDPALSLRAVDPGEVGGAARAVHARLLAPDRAPAARCSTPSGGTTTIEHEYLIALLLQLMNSGNMTRAPPRMGRRRARRMVRAAAAHARAVVGDVVLRRPRRRATGLRRRTPAPLEGRVLFLDTRPLHAVLMQNVIDARAEDQGPAAVGPHAARAASSSSLLTKLASQVDPEFKPFARRGERTAAAAPSTRSSASPRSRALPARGRALPDARSSTPATSFGGTMELAVFGRTRNEPDRRVEHGAAPARRRIAAPGGPWEVKDVSADRLPPARADERRQRGHARHARRRSARTGRRCGRSGIVRRMRRLTDRPRRDRAAGHREHAGRRRPGRAAQGARRRLLGRRRARPRSTAARSTACSSRCASATTEPAVQSLIVPAVEYQPAKRFKLHDGEVDQPDPLRAAARAAAGLGLGHGRAARASPRRCRRRAGRRRYARER